MKAKEIHFMKMSKVKKTVPWNHFMKQIFQGLYTYLKKKYPLEMTNNRKQTYIFTNRLNQDVLENF